MKLLANPIQRSQDPQIKKQNYFSFVDYQDSKKISIKEMASG